MEAKDGSKDGPLGLGLQVLDAGFTAPYLTAPAVPVDSGPETPREVSPPPGRGTGGAPVTTPEATARAAWLGRILEAKLGYLGSDPGNGCIKLIHHD